MVKLMQLTTEQARTICATWLQATRLFDKSLEAIKSNENGEMTQAYIRLGGQFLGHSYTNILAPIWAQFPELEPAEVKQAPELIGALSEASLAAIDAFLQSATPALAHVEQVLESSALPYGGLPEIKDSIAQIEAFRNRPRSGDVPSADHAP
jgi:hypothetical protein